jgi:hypothetical protein
VFGGPSRTLTASKAGYTFNILSITYIFSFSDETASFIGTATPLTLAQIPILLTRDSFQHALALDSATLAGEPFNVSSTVNFSNDHRTRVSLAVNLDLGANENLSAVTAESEDSLGNVFPLTIESLVAVPGVPWLKQLVVKLPDEIANKIEVRVRIRARGFESNKVIIKVKP